MRFFKYLMVVTQLVLLSACQQPQEWQTSDVTGAIPELNFELIETSHKAVVTAENFKGKINLLFFGFTHCPQVCPTTLLQLQQARAANQELSDQIQILFVSVDPERDDVMRIQQYVDNFDGTIGLRADEKQLQTLAKRYFIKYDKEAIPADGNYDMMHSSQVYVFDKQGQGRLIFRSSDPVSAMTADLQRLIKESS